MQPEETTTVGVEETATSTITDLETEMQPVPPVEEAPIEEVPATEEKE